MVNQKSLVNLRPDNRSQGKQRINITLKPETIKFLREKFESVSQGIEQLALEYTPESSVKWYKSRLESVSEDLLIRIADLQQEKFKNNLLEERNQKLQLECDRLKLQLESENTHKQIKNSNSGNGNISLDEKFMTDSVNFCDFIYYERIRNVEKESTDDLMIVSIFAPKKNQLTDIKKSLDLLLGRHDGKIGEIVQADLGKEKKWQLKFECFNVPVVMQCLEKIKQELSP
jgi:hypothetical protein